MCISQAHPSFPIPTMIECARVVIFAEVSRSQTHLVVRFSIWRPAHMSVSLRNGLILGKTGAAAARR